MMNDKLSKKMKQDFGIQKLIIPKHTKNYPNAIYEISEKLKNLKIKIKPISIGLLLAKNLHPTHKLLEINKNQIKNYLILNKKSAFLFTCNRAVHKKSIIKKIGNGPFYIAMNENKEILGIVKFDIKGYNNIINIGTYHDQDKLKEILF